MGAHITHPTTADIVAEYAHSPVIQGEGSVEDTTPDLSWAATLPEAYAAIAAGDKLDEMLYRADAEESRNRAKAGTVFIQARKRSIDIADNEVELAWGGTLPEVYLDAALGDVLEAAVVTCVAAPDSRKPAVPAAAECDLGAAETAEAAAVDIEGCHAIPIDAATSAKKEKREDVQAQAQKSLGDAGKDMTSNGRSLAKRPTPRTRSVPSFGGLPLWPPVAAETTRPGAASPRVFNGHKKQAQKQAIFSSAASDISEDSFDDAMPTMRRITTDGSQSCECSFTLKSSSSPRNH